jgi:hypothetical protein
MMVTRKTKRAAPLEIFGVQLPPGLAERVRLIADARGLDPQAVLLESAHAYFEALPDSPLDLNMIEASAQRYRH